MSPQMITATAREWMDWGFACWTVESFEVESWAWSSGGHCMWVRAHGRVVRD